MSELPGYDAWKTRAPGDGPYEEPPDEPLEEEPETYLDDEERYGEREERIDPQTGFVDD